MLPVKRVMKLQLLPMRGSCHSSPPRPYFKMGAMWGHQKIWALCVGYYESLGGCRIGKKCPLLLSLSYLLVASTLLKTARNERLRGRLWKVRAYFIWLKFPWRRGRWSLGAPAARVWSLASKTTLSDFVIHV